jgi:hypothetical protein
MKYDVVVYLSSLQKQLPGRKVDTLTAFAHGAKAIGANVHIETNYIHRPGKLAVMLGWPSPILTTPNIKFRAELVKKQKENNDHIMSIDANCFKFADTDSIYLRYSINSVEYHIGQYANKNSTADKWIKLSADLKLNMLDWRTTGKFNLLLVQRDGGWGMKGLNPVDWARNKIKAIQAIDSDPIILRPHPGKIADLTSLASGTVKISNSLDTPLLQDIRQAKRAFVFNSSSGVAAIMSGVPLFVDDPSAVCWNVANHSLDTYKSPLTPDRTQWINDLAACHWTDEESSKGDVYKAFIPYLN